MASRPVLVATTALIGLLLVAPLIVSDPYFRHLLVLGMLFAILASNWDLTIGYAGIFNFAHIAFFAIGAYTSAIFVQVLDVSPWVSMAAAAVFAMLAGAAAFVPAVRLRGVYVALTTFAFTQLCQWLVLSQRDVTGGTQGMVGIRPLTIGDYVLTRDGALGYWYLVAALLVASTVLLRKLVTSQFGTALVAIRDSEEYAQSRGIHIVRQQLLAFVASAAFTGVAGAFYAHYIGAVSPDLFGFPYQALLLSMVWLGGVASIFGPIVGAVILTVVSETLSPLGPWRFIFVSILIILTIRFLPTGVWGFLGGSGALAAARRRLGQAIGRVRASL